MKPTIFASPLADSTPPHSPIAAEIAQRIRALAENGSDINDRLGSMFGEGNTEHMAVPQAAGVFGEITAAIADLEMFMERISSFVARIY